MDIDILTLLELAFWGYPFVVGLVSGSLGWKFSNKLIVVSFIVLVTILIVVVINNASKGAYLDLSRTIGNGCYILFISLFCYGVGFGITHLIYGKKEKNKEASSVVVVKEESSRNTK
jgi:hypothetical protein